MSEPGGWTTPDGWGRPASAPPPAPPGGQPGQERPARGQDQQPGQPEWGQEWGQQPGQQQWGPPPGWGQPAPWGSRPLDAKPGVVPLRPLGLGEVLDGAVGVLRRYPRPALGLGALVALVTTVVNVLLLVTAFQPFLELDPVALESGDLSALDEAVGSAFAGGVLSALLSLVSGAVLTGAITAVVGKAVLGEPFTFAQAWAQVRPRLLPLVGLALLVLAIVYGVLIASVVAGVVLIAVGGAAAAIVAVPLMIAGVVAAVWLYVRLALAPCALVLERVGVLASLRRSAVLVRRDWWRVFGILLLTLVIGLFVSQVVELPFALFGAESPGALFDPEADVFATRSLVMSAIGGGIASTLIAPFTAGVRALLYVDRRIRAEGLDVSLAAAAASRS